jgi:hypothetical protein
MLFLQAANAAMDRRKRYVRHLTRVVDTFRKYSESFTYAQPFALYLQARLHMLDGKIPAAQQSLQVCLLSVVAFFSLSLSC